jgi:hypothetical protein
MDFNLLVATPSSGNCKAQFAFSLANLVMYFTQNAIYDVGVSSQSIEFQGIEGTGVSSNREKLVRHFLKSDATHLLFIDDDMGFNPDVLHILASRRLPIVGCNYRLRTPPAPFMAWGKGGEVKTTKESSGVEEVTYMGFGFCLLERQVLESVPEPRFLQQFNNGHYTTEDSVFFKKAPYKCYVDHDASKKIWHTGSMAYTYADDFSNINQILRSTL